MTRFSRREGDEQQGRMVSLRMLSACLALALGCQRPTDPPPAVGGRVIWRLPYSESPIPVEPVVSQDQRFVYAATPDGMVLKARASDGSIVWSDTNGPAGGSPNRNVVLAGGKVVIAATDLFAYDTATGVAHWVYQVADDEVGRNRIVTDGETVFAGAFSGKVYAIDGRTGAARWITDLARDGVRTWASLPTLAHGLVFVCTYENLTPPEGTMWALDAASGAVRWSYHFSPQALGQHSGCFGSAGHAGDLVIQAQDDGRVYGFDALTGKVRWTAPRVHMIPTAEDPRGHWNDIRTIGSNGRDAIVLSGSTGIIISFDPVTGAERWRVNPFGGGMGTPVLTDDRAYIPFGGIYASIDLTTGRTIWQDPQPGLHATTKYGTQAAVGSDRVYIGGFDGLYAVRP